MDKSQPLLGGSEADNYAKAPTKARDLESHCDLPSYYTNEEDRKAKLEIFKDSPFLQLLRAPRRTKSMPVCSFLLAAYDAEKGAFSLRGKYLKLCIEEAGTVLGLKNEGEGFSQETLNITSIPSYYENYLAKIVDENGSLCKDHPLSKKSILHVLKYMVVDVDRENAKSFKKIMYIYLYSFVFACTTSKKASLQAFALVEDIERFERINWLKFMVTKLEKDLVKLSTSLRSADGGPKLYFTSFTPLLEAWYYYRTQVNVDRFLDRAPIEYYISETRLEKLEKNLNVNNIKHRCPSCAEIEEKLERGTPSLEGEGNFEATQRTFRIQANCCFEKQALEISEEIGHKVFMFCLEGLMPYAKSLGFNETLTELLDMMMYHVEPEGPDLDSWSLVQAFLDYKQSDVDEDEPDPLSAIRPYDHGVTGKDQPVRQSRLTSDDAKDMRDEKLWSIFEACPTCRAKIPVFPTSLRNFSLDRASISSGSSSGSGSRRRRLDYDCSYGAPTPSYTKVSPGDLGKIRAAVIQAIQEGHIDANMTLDILAALDTWVLTVNKVSLSFLTEEDTPIEYKAAYLKKLITPVARA